MKKAFALMVCMALCGAALFGQTDADFETKAEGDGVVITKYKGSAKNVTIPGRISNLLVTAIGEWAFSSNQLTITSVTIPNSVATIREYAFNGNRLTSVTIPNSVTSIGAGAFQENRLTSVTIPANVAIELTSFSSLLYALYNGGGRKAAVYDFSRSREGDFDIVMCNKTLAIEGYHGTATRLTIPAEINGLPVTAIEKEAFWEKRLTGVTIPNSVIVIGNNAFRENQLTSVTIPGSVTAIGINAFAANRLTSVTIPNSVATIGNYAFSYNQLTSVTVPNSVMGEGVFQNNQLTSVTIPNSVATIGNYAFSNNQLTSVTIPNSVATIGNYAFSNNQLTSVTIPNSVATMGEGVFQDNQLTSVTIPANVDVAWNSFDGRDLDDAYRDNDNRAGTYQFRNGKYEFVHQYVGDFGVSVENNAVTITDYTGSAKNITIPGRINNLPVTAIGEEAFSGNQLTSVTIPNTVTSIGYKAFAENQLTSVTIPGSIITIGVFAFYNNRLTSVTIPGSVTTIEGGAFADNRLTSVTIPNSVIDIGNDAFADNRLTSVTIPNSVIDIGSGAFRYNALTSVTIEANVDVSLNPFPGNLAQVYTQGGSRAGTYRSGDGGKTWTRQ